MYQYFHHIALVHAGWRDGDLNQAAPLLRDCPPDQRHLEWHYLTRLCRADLLTLPVHPLRAWDAAFSPDGTWIASAGEDGAVKIWDARTGEVVRPLTGHEDQARCVAFSLDGTRIASASSDRTVRIWEVRTGQSLPPRAGHDQGDTGVAFGPDGAGIASPGSDGI